LLSTCYWQAFEVDEDAPEYRALHPNKQKSKKSLVAEHFDLVSEDHKKREAENDVDSDASSSSSDEGERMSTKKKRQQISENAGVAGKKPRLLSDHFYVSNKECFTNQDKRFSKLFGFSCLYVFLFINPI
jgi:hypothetical protein